MLWERSLVHAVALGVSEELARGLATRISSDAGGRGGGFPGGGGGRGGGGGIGAG